MHNIQRIKCPTLRALLLYEAKVYAQHDEGQYERWDELFDIIKKRFNYQEPLLEIEETTYWKQED